MPQIKIQNYPRRDDYLAKDLEDTAIAHHMDVLLEVHDEQELARAVCLGLASPSKDARRS